jgi:adenine-specific DNA-methyltransferase
MTELIWDGKYVDGKKQSPVHVALPFQTIETVNESAADRRRTLELFSAGRETEWRNRLIWGDKKYVLPSLLPEFAGKVNLIYIDPPFDTGADFSFTASIPSKSEDSVDATTFLKEPSILEQKAYRDTWGQGLDSYLEWFYETTVLLRELLHETGSLYVHLDYHVAHYAKVALDEVFGSTSLVNEIIWRRANTKTPQNKLGVIHDTLLWYAKGKVPIYNIQYHEFKEDYLERKFPHREPDGRRYQLQPLHGKGQGGPKRFGKRLIEPPHGRHWSWAQERIDTAMASGLLVFGKGEDGLPRYKDYYDGKLGIPLQTIWNDLPDVNSQAEERVNYPTQKPEGLLERLMKASSSFGDLVLDCFVGSGTTAVVAEKLSRRWIACDLGRFAIHTTRKRLLAVPGVRPFAVQNLGKYERQAWQSAEFPSNGKDRLEEQRDREAAYRKFILDLYHAASITGQSWLHGVKGARMVHVGAVDAPVTISDVKAIAREVWKAASGAGAKAAVDILGWEFALELNETARNVAAESRVDVAFKKIPREVLEKKAVEQGDVKFFELGALSVDLKEKKCEVTVMLTDFVIPLDDVPEEARKAVKHWSQMVDYWAVDWDFKEDTFHNQWQSYRTRKDPEIDLQAKYTYAEPGKYTIVVKVIDILGNDTTKTLEVSVK